MKLENLEASRKKAGKSIIYGSICLMCFIIFCLIAPKHNILILILGSCLLIAGIILLVRGSTQFNKLKSSFKTQYLQEMIKEIFENAEYNPKAGLAKELVYSANLLKKADRYHAEDLIRGNVEGVQFISSDLKLEEKHTEVDRNGTRTYYVTYFLGRFFEFDFNKQFKGNIIVTEGLLPVFFSKYKRIELESVEFNKKFKTYSLDEHNAFYVLTPHLMEAIMHLEKNNPGTLAFSFSGSKLNIAINNNRDTFELKLFKPINEAEIAVMRRDLYTIIDIIKELKLNNKIFM